jgi:phosphoenolpyruvate-protein phosphotransferase
MSDNETVLLISGKAISPGLAEGRTFVHRDMLRSLDAPIAIEMESVEHELGHLEEATATITADLLALATRVEKEMDSKLGAVFGAHRSMLNDPVLKEELSAEIRQNLVSASSAVKAVFLRWEKRFLLLESQVARDKGDDMRDISNRLSAALAGIALHSLEQMPAGSVLVATRLLPSDTIFLSQNTTAAVLLEYGGAGSHAALFAREMGLPCIAGIPVKNVPARAWALVDASLGEVIVHPQAEHKTTFRKKIDARRRALVVARERARQQAVTRDGVTIAVLANVGCRADTETAMRNGAEGVGLYRTEQAYMGRTTPPDGDELLEEMRQALKPAKGEPVCVRLLDIGADKPLPYIGFLAETNPALGRRGIRLLREYPRLLETQLRAVLQLSEEFDLSVLVPMVALPEDIATVRECLTRLASELGFSSLPKLGAMIETPAAALSARHIEPHADFLSFGTNDLTQYAFAADRENAAVERYFNDAADVIFRLLRIAHDDAPDMSLSVCGELAGRAEHVSALLQCGIRTLSAPPPLIPMIKEAVRESWCNATYDAEPISERRQQALPPYGSPPVKRDVG